VHVVLLGAAAGGGFPQWNCWCPVCRVARGEPGRAAPRTQSSAAVSADGRRWFLLNASPDVREQVARLPADVPADAARHVPVEGVLLTDAELDHTLGVALLREGRRLALWATDAARRVLEEDSRLLPVTRAFAELCVRALPLDGSPVPLTYRDGTPSGLEAAAFPVAGDPPRFATRREPGGTIGLAVRDARTGGALAYVPGCGALDAPLLARLAAADVVLLDGTFWRDDELVSLGIAPARATDMGHAPISGAGGTLEALSRLPPRPGRRRVYTHVNNTNPVLVEDSAERRAVEAAGVEVGRDGMTFEL
jgi:pyrroloquinoline quinone biosynthesis protein B